MSEVMVRGVRILVGDVEFDGYAQSRDYRIVRDNHKPKLSGQYDRPDSCNKCGEMNNRYDKNPWDGETRTVCTDCGHVDYWAYGHFESGEDGLNAAKKYRADQPI